MLGRALKEVKLPFPDDFFPTIAITSDDDDMYRHAAQAKVHEVLRDEFPATRFHPAQRTTQWKLIGDRQDVQLYRERGVAQGNAVQVICVGTLNGTMEDVMWGLYAATTPAFKTQRSIMHADYLDASVLQVLDADDCDEDDTAFSYRFSGIKWLATAPSGKLTIHKRDMCWHETLGIVNDANGQEVGYLTIQSVRINECPPFDQFGVVRSSANVCYIFRKQPNGSVGVYMKGEHAVGGKSRSWGSDPVIVDMWLAVANVLDCTHSKRLTRMLRGKDLFCATQSKMCEICDQKVRGLKSSENCKICGKNVCDKCRISKPIYPAKHTSTFPCLMPFCKRCLSDIKDQTFSRAARMSFDQSEHSSSQDSGSGSYRQSIGNRSGVYSMYPPTQPQSVRGPAPVGFNGPPSMRGTRQQPHHFTNSGGHTNTRYSPTSTATTQRSGRSFASSEYSNFSSESGPPPVPNRLQQRLPHQQARGPVSRPREHTASFHQQNVRRDHVPQYSNQFYANQQQQYGRYGSGSIDSTHDVDGMESSFRRVRLSSDPSSISELSDNVPAMELPTRAMRARTTTTAPPQPSRAIDLSDDDDVDEVIEVCSRMAPPPPPEPVDVFHEDKLKYINSFSSDGSGNLANPTLSSSSTSSGAGGSSGGMDAHQRLLERLLQANMTAEATYLLAKYSNNLNKGSPQD